MTLESRVSRRIFLRKAVEGGVLLAGTALMSACGSQPQVRSQSELSGPSAASKPAAGSPEAKKALTPEVLISETARITRSILEKGDQGMVEAASYYSGRPLRDIRPSFAPLSIQPSSDQTSFSAVNFMVQTVDDSRKVLYRSGSNEPERANGVVTSLTLTVGLGNHWINSSDQVKALTLHKEFLHAKIWPILAKEYLQGLERGGLVRYEGNPSQIEKEDSMTFIGMQGDNRKNRELFDYSGHLLVWQWAKKLLEGPAQDRKGLDITDFAELYKRFKLKGLDFNVTLDSPNFVETAYGVNSAWAQTILEYRGIK